MAKKLNDGRLCIDVRLKRDDWHLYAIDTPERRYMLEEIKFWLGKIDTRALIEVILPMVASQGDTDIRTSAEHRLVASPGENPLLGSNYEPATFADELALREHLGTVEPEDDQDVLDVLGHRDVWCDDLDGLNRKLKQLIDETNSVKAAVQRIFDQKRPDAPPSTSGQAVRPSLCD